MESVGVKVKSKRINPKDHLGLAQLATNPGLVGFAEAPLVKPGPAIPSPKLDLGVGHGFYLAGTGWTGSQLLAQQGRTLSPMASQSFLKSLENPKDKPEPDITKIKRESLSLAIEAGDSFVKTADAVATFAGADIGATFSPGLKLVGMGLAGAGFVDTLYSNKPMRTKVYSGTKLAASAFAVATVLVPGLKSYQPAATATVALFAGLDKAGKVRDFVVSEYTPKG